MGRVLICWIFLSLFMISCQSTPVQINPTPQGMSRLTEQETADITDQAIQEIVSEPESVYVGWLTLSGDRVFAINYATDLKPGQQANAFTYVFNRVALAAAHYFDQTDTQARRMIVMAEDVNFPTADKNPPLYQVIIESETISKWVQGETPEAEFIKSWFVVPLEVFPTREQ